MIAYLLSVFRDHFRFIVDCFYKEKTFKLNKGRSYEDEQDTERGDIYVKEIVENFTDDRGDKHDPYVFDNRMYQCFRIPTLVEVVHLQTCMNGLKSLHRAEICAITKKAGELNFNAILGAGPLDLTSVTIVKLFRIQSLLTTKLSLRYCKVEINFSIDAVTGSKGCLQSVCIHDISGVSFSMSGFRLISWVASQIVNIFMIFLNRFIKSFVGSILERHICRFLPVYQFPVEGRNLDHLSSSEHENEADALNTDKVCLKTMNSAAKEIPTKFTSETGKPVWCTNMPILDDIVQDPSICNGELEDISIQFQFSKNNVVEEDVEPLTKINRPTCCVFFRPESVESFNEISELLACSFRSGVKDSKDSSFVKHSKDFVKLLVTNDESPTRKDHTIENKQIPCNAEGVEGEIERLMRRFFINYPKYVAFVRQTEEQTAQIDDKEKSVIEKKVQMSENEITEDEGVIKGHEISTDQLESYLLDKSNAVNISKRLDVVGQFSETSYDKIYETKTSDTYKTECSSSLPEDISQNSMNLSGLEKLSSHESSNQSTTRMEIASGNFNTISENKDFKNESECLSDVPVSVKSVENCVQKINISKDINKIEHVESILKWGCKQDFSDNLEEIPSFKSKNIAIAKENNLQKNSPCLIKDYFDQTKNLKNDRNRQFNKSQSCVKNANTLLMHLDKNQNNCMEKSVKFIKTCSVGERPTNISKGNMPMKRIKWISSQNVIEENNNTTVSMEKYKTQTAIGQLNAIGDSICMCFDNPYSNSLKKPQSTFFHKEFKIFAKSCENDIAEHIALFQDALEKLKKDGIEVTVVEESDLDKICNTSEGNIRENFELLSIIPSSTLNSKNTINSSGVGSIVQDVKRQSFEQSYSRTINDLPMIAQGTQIATNSSSFASESTEGSYLTEHNLVSKDQVRCKSDAYNPHTETILSEDLIEDYEALLEWIPSESDEFSEDENSFAEVIDLSSDSADDENDSEKSVVCTDFKYATEYTEKEPEPTANAIGMEKTGQLSIANNVQISDSEESRERPISNMKNTQSSNINIVTLNLSNGSSEKSIDKELHMSNMVIESDLLNNAPDSPLRKTSENPEIKKSVKASMASYTEKSLDASFESYPLPLGSKIELELNNREITT